MSKIIQRLLVFFIGIPVIIGVIYIFPYKNHLVLHIMIIAVTFISALEMHNILKNRLKMHNAMLTAALSTLTPVMAAVCAVFGLSTTLIAFTFIFSFLLILVIDIFKPNDNNYAFSLSKIASSLLILMYPGFLITFLSLMTIPEQSSRLLVVFMLMVFGCDSLAWVCGMTMGKGNRGLIAASPNKSIAGFIGGMAGAVLVGGVSCFLFPDFFGLSIPRTCFLGFFTACAAILGDLAESVFKRSGEIKDSGTIIPGRGGLLDSIDSILMSAPVFYVCAVIMYGV
ncbi:MAG: phosphatidate cytidylyltransferase [Spirochaetaceae bacterium]|jgi:phosphatidate cytidylyltransferase|nr:phosphatidate cytidylyltransferase [Spirochaetaceae bacterium]